MTINVGQLCGHLGLECRGDAAMRLQSVAGFSEAGESQLTFLVTGKSIPAPGFSTKAAVITTPRLSEKFSAAAIILADNPQLGFARAVDLVVNEALPEPGIDKTASISSSAHIGPGASIAPGAVIESGAKIGSGVWIGANTVIGRDVCIGQDTRIDANVTIYAGTEIGRDCRISAGTTIGSAGFGIVPDGRRWVRFPQLGRVIIGDHVDIGANCGIDRGALGNTIIESGVKMDNLIQVAHNVCIGENTVIAAFTGIAGSTRIGKNCRIGGRASIQGHITIADEVVVAAVSFINKSIVRPGMYSSSVSAQENADWLKNHARLHRLDKLARQVNRHEQQLNAIIDKGEGRDEQN